MSRTDAQPVHAYIDAELVAEAVDNNTGLVGSAIPEHLPQAQVSGMVRGPAPIPYAVPLRHTARRRLRAAESSYRRTCRSPVRSSRRNQSKTKRSIPSEEESSWGPLCV